MPNKFVNHFFSSMCSEKGYMSLFKACVFLIGCSLVALSQVGTTLCDKELNAYKSQFIIEAELNKPLETIDCLGLQNTQRVECLMAKHEIGAVSSTIELFNVIINCMLAFSMMCGVFSVIGFFSAPYYSNSELPK
jgi:hypothetical protein